LSQTPDTGDEIRTSYVALDFHKSAKTGEKFSNTTENQMKVRESDSVESPDLYLHGIYTRFKVFMLLSRKLIDGASFYLIVR
jgi:hypothetical protein